MANLISSTISVSCVILYEEAVMRNVPTRLPNIYSYLMGVYGRAWSEEILIMSFYMLKIPSLKIYGDFSIKSQIALS